MPSDAICDADPGILRLLPAGAGIVMVKGLHVAELGAVLPVIFTARSMRPLLVDRMTRAPRAQPVLGLA